jgi:hypothetical protein
VAGIEDDHRFRLAAISELDESAILFRLAHHLPDGSGIGVDDSEDATGNDDAAKSYR